MGGIELTREDAKSVIYQLINSGILDEALENKLLELCEHLCKDDFEECDGTFYCQECNKRRQD